MGWFKRFSDKRIFVETGTFKGDGIQRALEDFEYVYSIELNEDLWRQSALRFEDYPNVSVIHGDSAKVLKRLRIDEPCVFYLDAHWSGWGDETALPLLDELEAISERPYSDVVVIDDMRLMGKKSVSGDDIDWPKAEFDFREATLEAISEACPGRQEWADDIDRLIIYRD